MTIELVPCPACGRPLSPEAKSCPNCGHPRLIPGDGTQLSNQIGNDLVRQVALELGTFASGIKANYSGGRNHQNSPEALLAKPSRPGSDADNAPTRVSLAWQGLAVLVATPILYMVPYIGMLLAGLALLCSLVLIFGTHYRVSCPSCRNSVLFITGEKRNCCRKCGQRLTLDDKLVNLPSSAPKMEVPTALPCPSCDSLILTSVNVSPSSSEPLDRDTVKSSAKPGEIVAGVLLAIFFGFFLLIMCSIIYETMFPDQVTQDEIDKVNREYRNRKVKEQIDDWVKKTKELCVMEPWRC